MSGVWTGLLRALGLTWALTAGPVQASEATRDAMERAGALLGAMKERLQTYRDAQFKRPPLTADARTASAQRMALELAGRRHELAKMAPKFDPGSRFGADLNRFLKRWPDDEAIRKDLLDESWGERVQTVITGLWLQVPDNRSSWKTLFPWFRP